MHLLHIFLTVLTLAVSATSVKVHVYGGIKECEDSEKIKNKNVVKMHYTGTIASASKTGEKGKQFDSTLTRGTPVEFQIGSGQAMKGFEKGLLGLCKGVKVKLLIPPREGYGDRGVGDIPAGATLLFDIEVLDTSTDTSQVPEAPNYFKMVDTDGDKVLTKDEYKDYFKKIGGGADLPDELFNKEDYDGDGVISWDEFSGPKGSAEDEL